MIVKSDPFISPYRQAKTDNACFCVLFFHEDSESQLKCILAVLACDLGYKKVQSVLKTIL